MRSDDLRLELEQKIFDYFLEDYKNYAYRFNSTSFKESFNRWANGEVLNSPIMRNYIISDLFEKNFGLNLHDTLAILKENKTTFRDYVVGIMLKPEFKLEEKVHLKEGILDSLLGSSDSSNGTMQSDSNVDPEEVKKEVIKKSLGNENIDLDNLTDEELDALMARTVKVEEKVSIIKEHLSGKDNNIIAEAISKYTGMHLNEALSIVEDY